VSKGGFGANIKRKLFTPINSVTVKNNTFFIRKFSAIIPVVGDNTIDIIDIIIVMELYVVIENPNCLAIVGKNTIVGPKPITQKQTA